MNLLKKSADWSLWSQVNGGNGSAGGGLLEMLPLFIIIGMLFYFLILRPEQKRRRKHGEMLSSLKKNDRILTSSGIYGTVVNVHQDGGDVTIKVDESLNVKMRVIRSSIGQVLSDGNSKENTSNS